MAEAYQAPLRPWTPTEKPEDKTSNHPVVYIGDHQLHDNDSDVSSDGDDGLIQPAASATNPVRIVDGPSGTGLLRFKSSQALRDDAAASAPEPTIYQAYRPNTVPVSPSIDIPQGLRPKKSHTSLSPKLDQRLPENNPYRLSRTLHNDETIVPKSPPRSAILPNFKIIDNAPSDDRPQLTRLLSSESSQGLTTKSQSPPRSERPQSQDSLFKVNPQPLSQAPPNKTIESLPSVTGKSMREIKILLVNPTSTKAITERYLESISESLAANVTVYGFTAARPAPTAIESHTDATMSSTVCTKAILPIASKYDAFLIASYGYHPLIAALREHLMQPVIGIMEASLYASRMCGTKFGILTTGPRSAAMHDASVRNVYKLSPFSVGAESVSLAAHEIEALPEEELERVINVAARKLQMRGADCICLDSAGFKEVQKSCQDAIGHHDRIALMIDGISIGVQFLVALVHENLGTAKGTAYNTASGHKSLRTTA